MRAELLAIVFVTSLAVAAPAAAQSEDRAPTHGGYGAFGGAVAFSAAGAVLSGSALILYSKSERCRVDPEQCGSKALRHVAMGSLVAVSIAGIALTGYGAQKLTEKWAWNPYTGWALSGAYVALPATLLLQNALPSWEPEWTRDVVGVTLGVGGGIGGAFLFREIASRRGHAWPEFGFGAGGMGAGLIVGQLVAPNTAWVPILGGVGAILGASAAALAF